MSHKEFQQPRQLSLLRLNDLLLRALRRAGMSESNAPAVAHSMLACERDGVHGHGILRLQGFVNSLETGWADGKAVGTIVAETPSLICVDAGNGFVQPNLHRLRRRLVRKVQDTGVCILQVRNSHHFAALWPDLEPFVEEGLVTLSCVNSRKRMAGWGGGQAVLGTNAMAFAVPHKGGQPIIWDQSSSVLSQGDVLYAAKEGRPVEPGVGVDREGFPTTDPREILDGGALLPFGGAKGASLAFMVEVLSAGLSGGFFGYQDQPTQSTSVTSRSSYFLMLIDPRASSPDFDHRIAGLLAALREAGADRLPGDRRNAARVVAEQRGVFVSQAAFAALLSLAGEADEGMAPSA